MASDFWTLSGVARLGAIESFGLARVRISEGLQYLYLLACQCKARYGLNGEIDMTSVLSARRMSQCTCTCTDLILLVTSILVSIRNTLNKRSTANEVNTVLL